MKHFSIRFIVAALTFLIGVSATLFWFSRRNAIPESQPVRNAEQPAASPHSSDPCSFTRTDKKKLKASECIQLAECFIIQNGYTDLPPIEDKSKLTPESVYPGIDKYGMKMRHDSLERQAYGYWRGIRYSDGWVIVFREKYKSEYANVSPNYEEHLKRNGRAVTMDAYGDHIRMEHQDIYLNFPELVKIYR